MAKDRASDGPAHAYARAVSRLRDAAVPGRTGRVRDLFDYLALRGPDSPPATQAEISAAVFGQAETDADDATVRVYVHRLRRKLEDHYRDHPPAAGEAVLEIPSGIYALQVAGMEDPVDAASTGATPPGRALPRHWPVWAVLALVAAFVGGVLLSRMDASGNAIWDPLIESDRPVLLVLGDYYLYGEIDPVRPEEGRLVRDFRVNSAQDLLVMQEAEPERYGNAEDVGLNYLPFQTAFALEAVTPLLAGKQVQVIATSELTSAMLADHDVVYIGLLSGMGLLEEITFAGSSLRIGESYDEIIDRQSGQRWASDEARRLASPAFYRDFAYVARLRAPGGGLVTVVASERITGLRGIGAIVADRNPPSDLAEAAEQEGFEALFQITGQQGADLSERLLLARSRH